MRRFLIALALVLFSTQVGAGVLYRINGIIDLCQGEIIFNTEDCRVFKLKMSENEAKKHAGKTVQIDAVGEDATRVNVLKVKKIRPFNKRIYIKNPKAYKNSQRPPRLLNSSPRGLKVANVRWSRQKKKDSDGDPLYYWRKVNIKPELIENVYFIKKPFPPEWIAAHCLMLYTFKKGGLTDEKGNESRGLVLSIEAYQRKDQSYSLKEGLKNKFGIVWQLTTWEDYAAESCHFADYQLIAYPVRFNNAQKKQLLNETIKESVKNRRGEFYHTTRNNCTNNLVILLDKVAKKKIRFWTIPSMIYNMRATMPVMVPKYLQKKGLLDKECSAVSKNNFFADPSQLFK